VELLGKFGIVRELELPVDAVVAHALSRCGALRWR
jgi:hypothetical protein